MFPSVFLFNVQKYSHWIRRCSRGGLRLYELLLLVKFTMCAWWSVIYLRRTSEERKARSLIHIILSWLFTMEMKLYEEACTLLTKRFRIMLRDDEATLCDEWRWRRALCTRCITKSPNAPSATIEVIHIQCTPAAFPECLKAPCCSGRVHH